VTLEEQETSQPDAPGAVSVPAEAEKSALQRRGRWHYIEPSVLYATMAIVVIVGIALVASALIEPPPGRVELAGLPDDPLVTVNFAGFFPPDGTEPLQNPLGAAYDGRRLYVAESDAGRIAVFDREGGRHGAVGLPLAPDALGVYPASVAVVKCGKLAVVDTAASRVIIVRSRPAKTAKILMTLGANGNAPIQPTAVAWADGSYYVADGADQSVKVYDAHGDYVSSIDVDDEVQPLSFVGGMAVGEAGLVVADSNLGRLLGAPPNGDMLVALPGSYALPRGITAVGDSGFAVSDAYERTVYVLSDEGRQTHVIDEVSVPEGPLAGPQGVVWVGKTKRLYVVDAQTGRLMVFNVRL
jgi:DNA-binding beta-propeller fold protein YncE